MARSAILSNFEQSIINLKGSSGTVPDWKNCLIISSQAKLMANFRELHGHLIPISPC